MTQAKLIDILGLTEMAKIDHVWSRLKGAKFFTILDIRSGFHHILIHQNSRPKQLLLFQMEKSNENK